MRIKLKYIFICNFETQTSKQSQLDFILFQIKIVSVFDSVIFPVQALQIRKRVRNQMFVWEINVGVSGQQ